MDPLEELRQSSKPGYNAQEAARLTGRDARTVSRACAKGQIPAHRLGRHWFISRETLLELLGAGR